MNRFNSILVFLIFLSFSAFSQVGNVFGPTSKNIPKKTVYGFPEIYYRFKEMKDTMLYNASVKEVRVYQTYRTPFINDNELLYVNPSLQFSRIDSLFRMQYFSLQALRFYADTSTFKMYRDKNYAEMQTVVPYHYLYKPFYMLNAEVSNKEYREFVSYVRDSIARTLLMNGTNKNAADYGDIKTNKISWKKPIKWDSDEDDYKLDLQALYLPAEERYFNRREIDTRKLNYWYYTNIKGSKEQYGGVVNVYPDTLAWVHDFITDFFLEPYTNMYFWHPAYENKPVVGLSIRQVIAFLYWKTRQLQKQLDAKKIKFVVECDLPNEIEWELVNTAYTKKNYVMYLPGRFLYDKNYLPNLYYKNNVFALSDTGKLGVPYARMEKQIVAKKMSKAEKKSTYELKDTLVETDISNYAVYTAPMAIKELNDNMERNFRHNGNVIMDAPVNEKAMKAYKSVYPVNDPVFFTKGNVSEWMRENYDDTDTNYENYSACKVKMLKEYWLDDITSFFPFDGSYRKVLELYCKWIGSGINSENNLFVAKNYWKTAANYNSSYRLVRGANWYDRGDAMNGDMKKTFVSADSAYSTIGFRYVVRFKEKK